MPNPISLRYGWGVRPTPLYNAVMAADGIAYTAASNILNIASNATAANQTAGVALWNGSGSGVNVMLTGIRLTSDTAGVKIRIQHVTTDPALGTAVTPVNRNHTSTNTSAISVETSIATGLTIPSTALMDSIITGIVPVVLDEGESTAFFPPGSGFQVIFNEETASTTVNVGATLAWVEFKST